MKIHFYLLAFLLLPFLVTAQKTNPAPYCASEFNNNYNMMSAVSIGAYTHSFGVMGSTGATNTYLYVDTAKFPNISKDYEVSMFLDLYSVADTQAIYFGLWIDYNQNNLFDSAELIAYNHNTLKTALPTGMASATSLPIKIKAPASAKIGKTRMRISRGEGPMPYDSTFKPNPCATKTGSANTYGNTYDFDVNIIGLPSLIEEYALKSQLLVVPNPATNFININNRSTEKIKAINILDLRGKVMYSTTSKEQIDISSFAKGMYWANILMENGASEMRSFIKN